ncbi:response regulator transcription factor [Nakamurella sp. GG22]
MREDDMLRLSVECARMAVLGEDYAQFLADGVHRILRPDAGVGVTYLPVKPDERTDVNVVLSGAPPYPAELAVEATKRMDRHPILGQPNWTTLGTQRVSDRVTLPKFWDTDVWFYFHGHVDGKYGAGAPLFSSSECIVFIGAHKSRHDFDDAEMSVLDAIRGPLGSALAFRAVWDEATTRLRQTLDVEMPGDRLSAREAQVLTLVAKGWINQRIAHTLGLSERTVRKHLENINAKLGVTNRAAAVARWKALSVP